MTVDLKGQFLRTSESFGDPVPCHDMPYGGQILTANERLPLQGKLALLEQSEHEFPDWY